MKKPYAWTFGLGLALCLTAMARAEVKATAPTADVIQSRWDLRDIEFSYTGITTAYSCSAIANKVRNVVIAVGGHPTTSVRASGCIGDRPARTIFVHITTAIPRPASEPQSTAVVDRQKLLKRLGVRKELEGEFPARRQNVSLAEERKLHLAAGDCELMTELRDRVFPQLGVTVTEDGLRCIPRELGIGTPRLNVTALVPSGDAAAADRSNAVKR